MSREVEKRSKIESTCDIGRLLGDFGRPGPQVPLLGKKDEKKDRIMLPLFPRGFPREMGVKLRALES